MSLDGRHLDGAFVLAIPDSPLAAFRTIVGKGSKLGEYRCPCGYEYFVGECAKPMQSTNCPGCKKTIGGADHTPAVGNVLLSSSQQIQKGASLGTKIDIQSFCILFATCNEPSRKLTESRVDIIRFL